MGSDMIKIIILVLILFPAWLFAACGGSYTKVGTVITTYDASNECVQTAIDAADYGDTVQVADGNAVWEPSAQGCKFSVGARDTYLCVKKAVKLAGGSGTITFGTQTTLGGIVYQPDSNSASLVFEMSGFTFDGEGTTFGNSGLFSAYPSTADQFNPGIKIHDNIFRNVYHVCLYTKKLVYGVIYHNIFTDVVYPTRQDGMNLAWGSVSQAFGTDTNVFVEDNLFNFVTGVEGGMTDPGGGAPGLVYRYNTTDLTNVTSMSALWGVHGLQSMAVSSGYTCPSGCGYKTCSPSPIGSCDEAVAACQQWSTMKVEFYGNKVNSGARVYSQWYGLRGGQGLFFLNSNTVTGNAEVNYNGRFAQYSCDSCQSPATPAYTQHVRNAYNWANYANSTLKPMTKALDYCADMTIGTPYAITENVDYFNHNTSYNGTTQRGVYCGPSLPASCSEGDGAWITVQSCSDLSAVVGAKGIGAENRSATITGTLYRCSSAGAWETYYTPYTYPHPLRTEYYSAKVRGTSIKGGLIRY